VSTTQDVWTDPELRAFVRERPELVAIADALAQADLGTAKSGSGRFRRSSRLLVIAAALAVGATLALIAPWNRSSGSLNDLALAAIGSQPVLHVIAETEGPTGGQLTDIQTGRVRQEIVHSQEEIWFYAAKGLKRDTVRADSKIVEDTLLTPRGGYTPGGIVYDCAWIAAHPVQATRARVSCNASGENGTTPHVVPRALPTIDPALGGFVDGYRHALSTGQARAAGSGVLDGRAVDWLAFETSEGSERVALDHSTHKPVLLESESGRHLKIASIETTRFEAADFTRPRADELPESPSFGGATDERSLQPERGAIAAAVPGAVWAESSVKGLPLAKAERLSLRATLGHRRRPLTGVGLELDYGSLTTNRRLDISQPYVRIRTAPTRALGFGLMWGFVRGNDPPPGWLYTSGPSTLAFTVVDGTYVTMQASSLDLLLSAARALEAAG
jgi:hypothetical protein